MTRVYLVRHGETTWNQEGCLQGSADIPMSEVGQEQMRTTARFLGELVDGLFHVFSSDLQRCTESVAMLSGAQPLRTVVSERLREVDFGSWTGKTVDDVREVPAARCAWDELQPDYVWDGGESFAIACDRAAQAITEHIATLRPERLVIVTHGLIIQLLLALWVCGSMSCASRFTISNGSVTVLDWRSRSEIAIVSMNIVPTELAAYARNGPPRDVHN
jgi:broad specificity phosphatase PhoE